MPRDLFLANKNCAVAHAWRNAMLVVGGHSAWSLTMRSEVGPCGRSKSYPAMNPSKTKPKEKLGPTISNGITCQIATYHGSYCI